KRVASCPITMPRRAIRRCRSRKPRRRCSSQALRPFGAARHHSEDAIMDARPVLSATELEAALSELLNDEQGAALYERLFRQINLNEASREEIMLILA